MKNMINRTITSFFILGVLAVWLTVSVPRATAQVQDKDPMQSAEGSLLLPSFGGCSNSIGRGRYSFRTEGTILPGSPFPAPPGPYVSIGIATLDGRGNITLVANDNFNGNLLPPTAFTGAYTINLDCSANALFTNGVPFRAAFSDDGREFVYMLGVPGTVVSGVARKQ